MSATEVLSFAAAISPSLAVVRWWLLRVAPAHISARYQAGGPPSITSTCLSRRPCLAAGRPNHGPVWLASISQRELIVLDQLF
jgi:hypothetical protein